MADVRFEHSSAGYISLMQSDAMRGVLHEYSDAIESECNGAVESSGGSGGFNNPPYASFDFETSERAGVRIQTYNAKADYLEREYGFLQAMAGV